MTIEEAIKIIDSAMTTYGEDAIDYDEVFEAKDIAIRSLEVLEQQEKIEKYDKLKEAVGKIKAEIKTYDKKDRYPYGALGVSTALKIIDNHTEGLI